MGEKQPQTLPNDFFITSVDEYNDILNKEKTPEPRSIQD